MIRRWSCINLIKINSDYTQTNFIKRFDILKLSRSLNFKKYNYGITHFKRHKLASWKRQRNWQIYTQVLKHWIRDYKIMKFIARTQFIDNNMYFNICIYNFFYIKKKNPLHSSHFPDFLMNSFTKKIASYYIQHYVKSDSLFFLNGLKNHNLITLYTNNYDSLDIKNNINILPLLVKSENYLYTFFNYKNNSVFYSFENQQLNIFFKINFIIYKKIIYTYKIFVFFFLLKNFINDVK